MLSILKHEYYGLTIAKINHNEYAIGTQEDALTAAKEYIAENVWAFNSNFLAGHSCLSADIIATIQEKCHENCNEQLKDTITDFDHFCDDAISCDGLGHFLSPYDGEEKTLDKVLKDYVGSLDFSDIATIKETVGENDSNKILMFRIN